MAAADAHFRAQTGFFSGWGPSVLTRGKADAFSLEVKWMLSFGFDDKTKLFVGYSTSKRYWQGSLGSALF